MLQNSIINGNDKLVIDRTVLTCNIFTCSSLFAIILIQWTLVLTNMVFNEFLVISNKISQSPSQFWPWFNEFLIISIYIYIYIYILVSSSNFIVDLEGSIIFLSIDVHLELLNPSTLKNPMHGVVQNSNSKYYSHSDIAVILQLCIVNHGEFKQ